MNRMKSLILLLGGFGVALMACGSELHMPGETVNMPSSVSVGPQSDQRPGGSGASFDRNSRIDIPSTFPVFAHYMDWATVPIGWDIASTMPIRRDNPAGGYDSKNPEVILQHNAEMQANGILPMVSWWERNSNSGDAILDLYLSIPGPQIGILYEAIGPGRMQFTGQSPVVVTNGLSWSRFGSPAGNIDLENPVHAEMFISDMQHLQEKYFSRYPDRFYRIDGRPVVFIWISHAFVGPFDQVVARARERSSFYLVGSEFGVPWGVSRGHETVLRGMDAITSYGFYDPVRYGLDMDARFLTDYKKAVDDWVLWLSRNSPRTKLILPMNFAYDDTLIPDRRGTVFRSSYEVARAYAQMVRGLLADPCGSQRILQVAYLTSYNEHYEGTAVEPSKEYQDNYLKIIRETFAVPANTSPVPQSSPGACRDREREREGPAGDH